MRFLSSRRRHPAAKVLLLVAALIAMGGFYSVFAPASQSSADTGTSQQVAEGQALFAVGCASCHGLNGEGNGTADNHVLGPSLVGVGAAAVDFQVGTGRMPMARPAEQAPVKPNQYTEEEIAALAAFVASLGPGPDIPSEEEYNPEGVSEEDIARGGELFRTNCSACHNFAGAGGALPGGKYAPTLFGVSNKHLYEAMLTGPQQMPVFSDGVLTPEDKKAVIGYLNELHEQPNQGGLTLGGIGPVSEGLWAFIIGLGSLVGFAVWIAAKGAKAR
ncbi:MAG TPA: cytochrome c [Propionibacteriaceae bacterium]|nr:cytochrome c [Propionibacteriaceae bacterium]